ARPGAGARGVAGAGPGPWGASRPALRHAGDVAAARRAAAPDGVELSPPAARRVERPDRAGRSHGRLPGVYRRPGARAALPPAVSRLHCLARDPEPGRSRDVLA